MKATVVLTQNQRTEVLEGNFTTRKDIEDALSAKGIRVNKDQDWFEGLSKTKLVASESILPTNIMYKGKVTNDLVITITTTNKKIDSGASRAEAYQLVKDNNLQDAVKQEFGRNFTQVGTNDLINFVSKKSSKTSTPKKQVVKKVATPKEVTAPTLKKDTNVKEALLTFYDYLVENEIIIEDEGAETVVDNYLTGAKTVSSKLKSPYSEDELRELTGWIK